MERQCCYLKIPLELTDRLMAENLSPREWRCLLAIWRKTWGWNRADDAIAITQIQVMTGIKRVHVAKAIKRLIKKELIKQDGKRLVKLKSGGKWMNVYKPTPETFVTLLGNAANRQKGGGFRRNPGDDEIEKELDEYYERQGKKRPK